MNKTLLALVSVALIAFGGWYYLTHPPGAKVRIGGNVFTVELAVTRAEKEQGLGGRPSIADNHGMLFVYDHKEQYEFWMREMRFPLDFIWIEGEKVADITLGVPPPQPGEQPAVVKPYIQVDKVLEVNAGTVERLGIKRTDPVEFLDR
jgi:hypothetical protein